MNQLAQVALDAEKIIAKGGWTQGKFGDGDGPHCILGAIYKASGDDGDIVDDIVEVLEEELLNSSLSVVDWNDNVLPNSYSLFGNWYGKHKVRKVLRKTARKLKKVN